MFYVGQKVVCVDASGYEQELQEGATYTVSAVGSAFGCLWIGTAETYGKYDLEWRAIRFRPLTERPNYAEAFVRKLKEACAPKQKEKERVPAFEGRRQ